jgi:putative Flp pilus-assembly TadE/G-like protein
MRFTVPNTADRPRRASLQQGQAIVLIALLILVLFGMLGLAIDSGRGYVDRRDQQAAVDAAALSAGDWYENFSDLTVAIPKSVQLYENDLRLYGATPTPNHPATQYIGPNGNLPQDTYTYTWPSGYTLVVVATNTQFNGYQFTFTTTHNLPLAFIQIFGGSPSISIGATATAIVNNQRQTPALLTLSTDKCSSELTGSASLTVLGDVYSNGQACLDSNLTIGGNCYGAAGSNCNVAQYWCYSATPGVSPYQPPCNGTDLIGGPIVPAPTLPDPGYTANSVGSYTTNQGYNQWNRGTWTEMYPGIYSGNFHLSGGSASCAFLDAGVYYWSGGYTSDATGSFLSNELRAPDEGYIDANGPNYNAVANPQFWNQNGVTCSGEFNVSATTVTGGYGIHHNGSSGKWGIELTSVRYDTFLDPGVSNDPCLWTSSCRRESAPSECQEVSTASEGGNNAGIIVNITRNAPGAQYYNVYVNSNGCDGNQANFGFVTRFNAPGWSGGTPVGPWPSGSNVLLANGSLGLNCPVPTVSLCNFSYNQLSPTKVCYAQSRTPLCRPPDWEVAPQCFANCPPPANLLSQENAPMSLQYPFYTGGDVANENYCQISPNPGDPTSPCQGAQMTPGAVQFYLPAGACFSQNAQGATYVFAGEQFNWIVIYSPAANTCNETLNGGASTQYIGTIYTPAANWTISGSDRSPLAGQVICYTAKIAGGGQAGIDFNPNYSPAPPAARLIN